MRVMPGSEREQGRWHLLVAEVPLKYRPKRTADGQVVVPDRERIAARRPLENIANLLSLGYGSGRTLSSPNPYVAFKPETGEEADWLSESTGVHGGLEVSLTQVVKHQMPLKAEVVEELSDRFDGVALLSEALSAERSTSRFLDLIRLFERAFKVGPSKLADPLTTFLAPRFGYSSEEVDHWLTTLRGSVAHADQRNVFLLQADVRPYVPRVEQAAWDVLMNKKRWRSPDSARRPLWSPDGGSVDPAGQMVVEVDASVPMQSQISDRWDEFPLDLGGRISVPDDWWPRPPATMKSPAIQVEVVEAERWSQWPGDQED